MGALIIMTAYVVAVFYCLDALHGERRDRSILFWKSLPVSDRTTVLSKACIPLAVLPLIAYVLSVTAQLGMLFLTSFVLLATGAGATTLWARLPFLQMPFVMLYALIVNALWHAPIYAWLLLLSGWARRAVFLWALLPPLGVVALEHIAFRTSHFGSWIGYRLGGAMAEAFATRNDECVIRLSQLRPLGFLFTPGLWIGLIAAAAFLAAAVRLRRYREPI
jgi:ABC-2 type transport system permease protein